MSIITWLLEGEAGGWAREEVAVGEVTVTVDCIALHCLA